MLYGIMFVTAATGEMVLLGPLKSGDRVSQFDLLWMNSIWLYDLDFVLFRSWS